MLYRATFSSVHRLTHTQVVPTHIRYAWELIDELVFVLFIENELDT